MSKARENANKPHYGDGKNLIVNGMLQAWQRGESFESNNISSVYKTVDKFYCMRNTNTTAIYKQEKVIENEKTWIKTSILSSDNYNVGYIIRPFLHLVNTKETDNINSKKLTLSFYMKASVPGIYNVAIGNGFGSKFYNTEIIYNNPDVSQRVEITFETLPDTYNSNIERSLAIYWFYGVGHGDSHESDSNINSWGGKYLTTPSAVQWYKTVGAYVAISEIQLEEGSIATKIERLTEYENLAKCEEFYETGICNASFKAPNDYINFINFRTRKFKTPNVKCFSLAGTEGKATRNSGVGEAPMLIENKNPGHERDGFTFTAYSETPPNSGDDARVFATYTAEIID